MIELEHGLIGHVDHLNDQGSPISPENPYPKITIENEEKFIAASNYSSVH